jgi:hypothetical protein
LLLNYLSGCKRRCITHPESNLILSLSSSRPPNPLDPGPSLFFLTADEESLRLLCEAMSDFRGGRVECANLVSYNTPFYVVILRVIETSKRMEIGVLLSVGTKLLDNKEGRAAQASRMSRTGKKVELLQMSLYILLRELGRHRRGLEVFRSLGPRQNGLVNG